MKLKLPSFRRRAFTLLELLIVVVVIGILAALAIIRFGAAQERAYVATMQSDLRNFATARAIYVSEEAPPASVSDVEGYHFSEFVHELAYRSNSAAEWSLSVGHNKTTTACTLSALDLNRTHRISCGPAKTVTFASTETAPYTVEYDATTSIQAMAFTGGAAFRSALAASLSDIESITWDFGDGTRISGPPETHTKVTHTYASAGNYTVTLILVKKTGEVVRGSKTVKLEQNLAPTSSFSFSPASPTTADGVTFTSSSTDPEGGALTYAWDFESDGVVDATTATATVTFPAAATYSVKLTVTDPKGLAHSSSQSVVVGAGVKSLGKILYHTDLHGKSEIYVMNVDGTGATRLTNNLVEDYLADWSRDGSRIVFNTNRDGNTNIYAMNPDGTGQTYLYGASAHEYNPRFSPDGSKVSFDVNSELYLLASDGSSLTRLYVNGSEASWNADGSKLAFSRHDGSDNEILTVNVDGTGVTALTNNSATDYQAVWSPDGSKIAFNSNRDGNYELYVMNADGSNQTRLTNHAANEYGHGWSPDGSKIMFSTNRDGNYELYIINADGTGLTRVTNTASGEYAPVWR